MEEPPQEEVVREGYLQKQGFHFKTWRRRYFVLTKACLYYFTNELRKEVSCVRHEERMVSSIIMVSITSTSSTNKTKPRGVLSVSSASFGVDERVHYLSGFFIQATKSRNTFVDDRQTKLLIVIILLCQ